MKRKQLIFRQSAFTLAELLIVVAIIGILVAISIPIFTAQREKARRAVDMDNARKIKSALVLAYNNEDIMVPQKANRYGHGAWVMLCNGTQEYAPQPYHNKNIKGMWCGANDGVSVGGKIAVGDWQYNKELEKILQSFGLDIYTLRTHSNGGKDGWDWIIIEAGYDQNGDFITRMYSGYKNENGAAGLTGESNLEKQIYKK